MTELDFHREPCTKMKSTTNGINEITIVKNTGIINDIDGNYRYAEEGQAANQAFLIPEGGVSNEFLYQTMMSQYRETMNLHRETSRAIASLRNLILNPRHSTAREEEDAVSEGE